LQRQIEYSYMCEILGEEKSGYLHGFVQTLGPVSFQVRLSGGRLVRHHQNQIRKRMDAALRPGIMKIYTPCKYGHPGVPIFT